MGQHRCPSIVWMDQSPMHHGSRPCPTLPSAVPRAQSISRGEQLRMAITILGHLGPCNLANILERQTRHRAPELKLHHSRPCHQYHPIPPMYLCHACHLCRLCHLCLQPYPSHPAPTNERWAVTSRVDCHSCRKDQLLEAAWDKNLPIYLQDTRIHWRVRT